MTAVVMVVIVAVAMVVGSDAGDERMFERMLVYVWLRSSIVFAKNVNK